MCSYLTNFMNNTEALYYSHSREIPVLNPKGYDVTYNFY
jgi:hypothetical protein